MPKNVTFGDALGSWEDEMKEGEHIEEVAIAGAKCYAYRLNTGKVVIKLKGITLDVANSNIFTFERFKKMVLEGGTIESASRYQFGYCNSSKQIFTRYVARTATSTLDSKRTLLENGDTRRFGFIK